MAHIGEEWLLKLCFYRQVFGLHQLFFFIFEVLHISHQPYDGGGFRHGFRGVDIAKFVPDVPFAIEVAPALSMCFWIFLALYPEEGGQHIRSVFRVYGLGHLL